MEKIIKIEKYKQNTFKITFASGTQMIVSEDLLVKENLLKEKELTAQDFEQLQRLTNIDQGYQLSLRYLSYQLRSKKEIRDHLKKNEIESAYHNEILNKLEELNLLDDQAYAESYVRTMMRTSDKGPVVLTQQLKKKGISDLEITQALELFDETAQTDLAAKTADKMIRKYHSKNYKETRQKIQLNLQTKGFSREIIQQVMAELDLEKDEEQEYELLVKQGDKLWHKHQKLPLSKRSLKVKQSLFQKGYDYDLIQTYLAEKIDEEE